MRSTKTAMIATSLLSMVLITAMIIIACPTAYAEEKTTTLHTSLGNVASRQVESGAFDVQETSDGTIHVTINDPSCYQFVYDRHAQGITTQDLRTGQQYGIAYDHMIVNGVDYYTFFDNPQSIRISPQRPSVTLLRKSVPIAPGEPINTPLQLSPEQRKKYLQCVISMTAAGLSQNAYAAIAALAGCI